MQSNPSVQAKQSNRRHDSQFGPDLGHLQAPSTAQPNPAQPRYFPSGAHPQANQYTNHQALPRQGQGARLPTPVIEELNDEPTQKPLPQASGKFNPKPFARNQPGPPGKIKQNKPQAFSATGPAAVDQAMRQAYQAQVAAQANRSTPPSGPQAGRPPQTTMPPNKTQPPPQARPPPRGPARVQPQVETFGLEQPVTQVPAKRARDETDEQVNLQHKETHKKQVEEQKKLAAKKEAEKKEAERKEAERIEAAKPKPHFVPAQALMSPLALAFKVDRTGLWNDRRKEALAAIDQRQKDDQALQWSAVSDGFQSQEQDLEGVMGKFNELIGRYNKLAEIKNTVLEEKQDLTDRYRRAGSTLSTQRERQVGAASDEDEADRSGVVHVDDIVSSEIDDGEVDDML